MLTSTFSKVSIISLSNSASTIFLFCVTLFEKGSGMLEADFWLLPDLDISTSSLTVFAASGFSAELAGLFLVSLGLAAPHHFSR